MPRETFRGAIKHFDIPEDSVKFISHSRRDRDAYAGMTMNQTQLFRPKRAGVYLTERYGFGSEKTLNKLRCIGGGPEFCKAGRAVLYEPAKLDEWALAKIGAPQSSTSDVRAA